MSFRGRSDRITPCLVKHLHLFFIHSATVHFDWNESIVETADPQELKGPFRVSLQITSTWLRMRKIAPMDLEIVFGIKLFTTEHIIELLCLCLFQTLSVIDPT
jgi:hypothetical protein